MANQPKCLVGMEACGGSNHWAREITKLGHDVKLMAPQLMTEDLVANLRYPLGVALIC